jgi:hypothetical protein
LMPREMAASILSTWCNFSETTTKSSPRRTPTC